MPTSLKDAIKNFEAAKGVKAAETEKVIGNATPLSLSLSLSVLSFGQHGLVFLPQPHMRHYKES